MKKLVLLLVLAVLASGCLGNGGAQADDVRDSFVENNVSSYVHEGETSYAFGSSGGPTRTTTIDVQAALDRGTRSLHATVDSLTEGAGERIASKTTTYLVNGTVYSRTVRSGNTTGWVRFSDDADVTNTWDARDELGLYEDVLRNASVEHNGTETVRDETAHRLDVELGDRRSRLLQGKFRESPGFFDQAETESFRTSVWITDDGTLLRAETHVTMALSGQQTATGERDLNVEMRFVDTFRYEDVTVDPPREALNTSIVG